MERRLGDKEILPHYLDGPEESGDSDFKEGRVPLVGLFLNKNGAEQPTPPIVTISERDVKS